MALVLVNGINDGARGFFDSKHDGSLGKTYDLFNQRQ